MFDRLLDLLFVPRCAVCHARMDASGDGICDKCRRSYESAKDMFCDFCGMTAAQCYCMPYNLVGSGCMSYRKLLFYKKDGAPVVRSMIYAVKRRHTLAVMRFLADELAALTGDAVTPDTLVTFAPRTREAVRKYGYDQGRLIAKYYAKRTGGQFRQLLVRRRETKSTEQKLLNAYQRAANVRGAFACRRGEDLHGRRVVLIDDVVTSGSTMAECVRVLLAAGALQVDCVSLMQTYRENHENKDKND